MPNLSSQKNRKESHMKRKHSALMAIALALLLVMSFAGGALADGDTATLYPDFIYYLDDDGAYPTNLNSYYVTLSLNHSMLGLVPGDSILLHAYLQAPSGVAVPITWSSSDSSVVSVGSDGRIYARSTGWAVVTASAASLQVSCRVHVTLDNMHYDGADSYTSSSGYLTAHEVWQTNQAADSPSEGYLPLRTWQGEWNSIISYFDSYEVAHALDEIASSGNSSAFANDYNSVFAMDFAGMRIEENVVTLYDWPIPGGSVLYAYDYSLLETADYYEGGAYDGAAYIFQANSGYAPYRYLMLTPPQTYASYDTPVFFHMRYENSLDALLQYSDWSPIMVSADASPSQVAELLYQLAEY